MNEYSLIVMIKLPPGSESGPLLKVLRERDSFSAAVYTSTDVYTHDTTVFQVLVGSDDVIGLDRTKHVLSDYFSVGEGGGDFGLESSSFTVPPLSPVSPLLVLADNDCVG